MLLQKGFAMANDFAELIGAVGAGAARIPAKIKKKNECPLSPLSCRVISPDAPEKIVLVIRSATES